MKETHLLLATFLCFLTACNDSPAALFSTATPAPTATPAFASEKFGTTELDVTYCTMSDLPQKMDVYHPGSGGPWPVFVYVHGGGWNEGDKAEGSGWGYLTEQGYLVASVNYRLAAYNIKFPAMIEDVKCAVRYLRAHASDYNLDPGQIGVLGFSAGGHLAALLGTSDETAGWDVGEYQDQSSRVQAVVTAAGPSDFSRDFPSLEMSIYYAFGKLSGNDSPILAAASPVTYVTPDDPPFLILHGDRDGVVPVEQAEILHARLTVAGLASTLVIVQNGDHGLQGLPGKAAVPTQEEISIAILDFLDENLK